MTPQALEGRVVGHAVVLGHDVSTDELHPSSFFSLDDVRVRAGFLRALPERSGIALPADPIIVAGRNFGAGSSRETGARVFLLAGVRAVVAESFARIFHRNVLNLGLPAFECAGVQGHVADGALVTIDLAALQASTDSGAWPLRPLDPYHTAILRAGGLLPYLDLTPLAPD